MESNERAGTSDSASVDLPSGESFDAEHIARESRVEESPVDGMAEPTNTTTALEPIMDTPEAKAAEDRRRAEELADAIDPRPRSSTRETPFDTQAAPPSKIDWGGLGLAFFGGIGANFFLGILLTFINRLFNSDLYGPGVIAIMTGLFVVLQLLVPFSPAARRMTIAFWAGLLFGYGVIWVMVRPLLMNAPR